MSDEIRWDEAALQAAWEKIGDYPEATDIQEVIQTYLEASGMMLVPKPDPNARQWGDLD